MDGDEWTNQLFSISRSSWNSEEMEEWLRETGDWGVFVVVGRWLESEKGSIWKMKTRVL